MLTRLDHVAPNDVLILTALTAVTLSEPAFVSQMRPCPNVNSWNTVSISTAEMKTIFKELGLGPDLLCNVHWLLADRNNGRAYATMFRPSVVWM